MFLHWQPRKRERKDASGNISAWGQTPFKEISQIFYLKRALAKPISRMLYLIRWMENAHWFICMACWNVIMLFPPLRGWDRLSCLSAWGHPLWGNALRRANRWKILSRLKMSPRLSSIRALWVWREPHCPLWSAQMLLCQTATSHQRRCRGNHVHRECQDKQK